MKIPAQFLRMFLPMLLLSAISGASYADSNLENLFKNPKFTLAALSPNGKYLATTTNITGKVQLAVVDVETGVAKNLVGYDELDVFRIAWINDERIAFNIIDREGDQNSSYSGLYAISRDGGKTVDLGTETRSTAPTYGWNRRAFGMQMVGVFDDDPNSIIALGQFPNRDVAPYRVDSVTGRRKEIDFDVNGLARDFVFDAKNRLRVVLTTNPVQSELTVWYRDADGKNWKKLSEHPSLAPKFSVLAFDADDAMIVSAPNGEGRLGIFKYDFANNKPGELLASDKAADVGGGLLFSRESKKLLGVRMPTEPPSTLWFDKSYASLQAGIDKAYPGLVNIIYPSKADAPKLIHSYSSTNPGSYSLYHPDKKKVQNLFATRPWIDPKKMSEKLVYDYVARDGLPIMSYLTLPIGREAKALPLVVNVHGGPWARDEWGFDRGVQFLAGMGYAVLQPQFRGSTGFGDAHFKKSFAQWGLSMQDDITDGVLNLIKQGVVDPKRVCIMGASYGGYAAMMGLVKDPDLYRCGINLLGVTNLFYHSSESYARDRTLSYAMLVRLGDPDKLRDQFTATSPSKQAEKIRAPVFMAYGEKDFRVPIVHGEEMRDALAKHKKVYQYMELEKEEHGFAKEETRYRVYGAIEAFLKTYNPAK
jgi:dipeptidyl aminopeptidase/acylaminoacyl peptidase